jgi:peroxiredoxin
MISRILFACLATSLLALATGGCEESAGKPAAVASSAAGASSSGSAPGPSTQNAAPTKNAASTSTVAAAPTQPANIDSTPIGYQVGQRAPEWRLHDPSGREHALSDYRGNVVVMDFWATWCGPCRQAMPGMQKLHDQLASRNVKVFGITTGERSDPAAFMKSKNFTYGLLLNGDKVALQYGVRGIPAFFVVGVDGRVIHTAKGFDPTGQAEKNLHATIVKHLEEHGL